jgi:hypothetical protein
MGCALQAARSGRILLVSSADWAFACHYDRDVWLREREELDGYNFIYTHVDDFKIVARDPDRWKTQISAVFLLKSIGPPPATTWEMTTSSWKARTRGYSVALLILRSVFVESNLCSISTATWPEVLGMRQYQMLIGMAQQWVCTVG